MAAELGLLSLTQLQKFSQLEQDPQPIIPNQNPSSATAWMWNVGNQATAPPDDDDSWEVRAFAEDTGNIMGTTWPPRSYTCTFCRREFRSAQALGGHMNVHRRDRARLHQVQPIPKCHPISTTTSPNTTTTALLIPTTPQELVANGGLCLLYSVPNPNMSHLLNPSSSMINTNPSTISPSISPCAFRNFISSDNFQMVAGQNTVGSSLCHSSNTAEEDFTSMDNNSCYNNQDSSNKRKKEIELGFFEEEIDLELRLGRRRSSSSF